MGKSLLNTTLAIGMLEVPVKLCAGASSQEPEIDRASANGNRVSRVDLDSVTGERVVESEEARNKLIKEGVAAVGVKRGRWVPAGKGERFHEIPADRLAEIKAATKLDGIEVAEFMPAVHVPWERAEGSYYLAPSEGSAQALRTIRDALAGSGKVGVFKFVLRDRQHLAVLHAKNGGLWLTKLAFADAYAGAAGEAAVALAETEKPSAKTLKAATALFDSMTVGGLGERAVDTEQDELLPLKAQLIDEALEGKPMRRRKTAAPVVRVSDFDALVGAAS